MSVNMSFSTPRLGMRTLQPDEPVFFYEINTAGPNGTQPADFAFLAMIQQQLGQPSPARAALARLRETLQQNPRWANDADAQAFLREAAALIGGGSAKSKE